MVTSKSNIISTRGISCMQPRSCTLTWRLMGTVNAALSTTSYT
jgi:hypothetical protein